MADVAPDGTAVSQERHPDSAFFPGPWHTGRSLYGYHSGYSGPSIYAGKFMLAETLGRSPRAEATARLMAAAPDLLAALIGVVAVADRKTTEFDAARAAIAKAVKG